MSNKFLSMLHECECIERVHYKACMQTLFTLQIKHTCNTMESVHIVHKSKVVNEHFVNTYTIYSIHYNNIEHKFVYAQFVVSEYIEQITQAQVTLREHNAICKKLYNMCNNAIVKYSKHNNVIYE